MRQLPHHIYVHLVQVVLDLVGEGAQRNAIIKGGVYDKMLVHKISTEGTPRDFAFNLIYDIMQHDLLLLLRLVEFLSEFYAGNGHKRELEWIRIVILFILNDQPDPPNGRNCNDQFGLSTEKIERLSCADLRRLVENNPMQRHFEFKPHTFKRRSPIHNAAHLQPKTTFRAIILDTGTNEKQTLYPLAHAQPDSRYGGGPL